MHKFFIGYNGSPRMGLRSQLGSYKPWYNSVGVRQEVPVDRVDQLMFDSLTIVEIASLRHIPGSNPTIVVDCCS